MLYKVPQRTLNVSARSSLHGVPGFSLTLSVAYARV